MFPERENAEITCGQSYDYDTGDYLGPASDRLTYLSLSVKHRFGGQWAPDPKHRGISVGVVSENYATHHKRVYVVNGAVQDKVTGKRWT